MKREERDSIVADVYADLMAALEKFGPPRFCSCWTSVQELQEFVWYARNLQALLEVYGERKDLIRRVK